MSTISYHEISDREIQDITSPIGGIRESRYNREAGRWEVRLNDGSWGSHSGLASAIRLTCERDEFEPALVTDGGGGDINDQMNFAVKPMVRVDDDGEFHATGKGVVMLCRTGDYGRFGADGKVVWPDDGGSSSECIIPLYGEGERGEAVRLLWKMGSAYSGMYGGEPVSIYVVRSFPSRHTWPLLKRVAVNPESDVAVPESGGVLAQSAVAQSADHVDRCYWTAGEAVAAIMERFAEMAAKLTEDGRRIDCMVARRRTAMERLEEIRKAQAREMGQ